MESWDDTNLDFRERRISRIVSERFSVVLSFSESSGGNGEARNRSGKVKENLQDFRKKHTKNF